MSKIIKGDFPKKTKATKSAAIRKVSGTVYQLKITLLHCRPPIWRRILVPDHLTLEQLHDVIQLCMGWTDTHLHQFIIGKQFYGPPEDDDGWGDSNTLDERRYKLCDLEREPLKGFKYEYDFGDGWLHEIKAEKVVPAEEKPLRHPVLLAGKRACPPEDVGGPYGYMDFLEVVKDPDHEDHEAMLEWCGGDFDPEFFDPAEINTILKKIK